MIVREWRGRASSSKVRAFPRHFRATVLPELLHIPGFLGAYLNQRPIADDKTEFVVLTRWESIDAIRAFAGEDIARAVVEPDAVAALLDFDAVVQHYDVIEDVHALAG